MISQEKPIRVTGLTRVWKAFFYSISGLKLALRDEAAFRQELFLVLIMSGICLYLPLAPWLTVTILFSHALVLIVELLNTAVESIVDLASPEFHDGAKKAKDTASAAVLLSLVLGSSLWFYALVSLLY